MGGRGESLGVPREPFTAKRAGWESAGGAILKMQLSSGLWKGPARSGCRKDPSLPVVFISHSWHLSPPRGSCSCSSTSWSPGVHAFCGLHLAQPPAAASPGLWLIPLFWGERMRCSENQGPGCFPSRVWRGDQAYCDLVGHPETPGGTPTSQAALFCGGDLETEAGLHVPQEQGPFPGQPVLPSPTQSPQRELICRVMPDCSCSHGPHSVPKCQGDSALGDSRRLPATVSWSPWLPGGGRGRLGSRGQHPILGWRYVTWGFRTSRQVA